FSRCASIKKQRLKRKTSPVPQSFAMKRKNSSTSASAEKKSGARERWKPEELSTQDWLQRCSPTRPESPSSNSPRKKPHVFALWRRPSTSVSSVKTRRFLRCRKRFVVSAQDSKTPNGHRVHSSLQAPPVSEKPSWPRRSPSSSST